MGRGAFNLLVGFLVWAAVDQPVQAQEDFSQTCSRLLRFSQAESLEILVENRKLKFPEELYWGRDSLKALLGFAHLSPSLSELDFRFVDRELQPNGEAYRIQVSVPILDHSYRLKIALPRDERDHGWLDANLIGQVLQYVSSHMDQDEVLEWSLDERVFIQRLNHKVQAEWARMGFEEMEEISPSLEELGELGVGLSTRTESYFRAESREQAKMMIDLLLDPLFRQGLSRQFPWEDFKRHFGLSGQWDLEIEVDAKIEEDLALSRRSSDSWSFLDVSAFRAKAAAEVLRLDSGYVLKFSYRLRLKASH